MAHTFFSKYSGELNGLLDKAKGNKDFEGFNYFIKADISGIQDFIFYIQSKNAAKTLKSRSFFIQVITKICIERIKDTFGHDNVSLLYDGGGNFYLFLKINDEDELEKKWNELQRELQQTLSIEEFYIILSKYKITGTNFGKDVWDPLNQLCNRQKLQKYTFYPDVFEPYQNLKHSDKKEFEDDWKGFTGKLRISKGYNIKMPEKSQTKVDKDAAHFFGKTFRLILESSNDVPPNDGWHFRNRIVNKLPVWDLKLMDRYKDYIKSKEAGMSEEKLKEEKIRSGKIIEFGDLAGKAKLRTGTAKLGVLKMDIDNLGSLFEGLDEIKQTHLLSIGMEWFFEIFITHLLDEKFKFRQPVKDSKGKNIAYEELEVTYKDNIYVVFAGGDDCFIIGGWDILFDFAKRFKEEFDVFQKYLRKEIQDRTQTNVLQEDITLSAGLLVLDPHFPVVRFAKLAEEALEEAKECVKYNINGKPDLNERGMPLKNRITVFDQVLEWDEFEKAQKMAYELQTLIREQGESRVLLNRIKASAKGYEKLQEQISKETSVTAPKVWRLQYFIRNSKKEQIQNIINEYTKSLMDAFARKKATNPMVFPVAARWAEFLCRKS